jgi:hypothetical protein
LINIHLEQGISYQNSIYSTTTRLWKREKYSVDVVGRRRITTKAANR